MTETGAPDTESIACYAEVFCKQQHQIDSLRVLLSRQVQVESDLARARDALLARMHAALGLVRRLTPGLIGRLSDADRADWASIENLLETAGHPKPQTNGTPDDDDEIEPLARQKSLSSISESDENDPADLTSGCIPPETDRRSSAWKAFSGESRQRPDDDKSNINAGDERPQPREHLPAEAIIINEVRVQSERPRSLQNQDRLLDPLQRRSRARSAVAPLFDPHTIGKASELTRNCSERDSILEETPSRMNPLAICDSEVGKRTPDVTTSRRRVEARSVSDSRILQREEGPLGQKQQQSQPQQQQQQQKYGRQRARSIFERHVRRIIDGRSPNQGTARSRTASLNC